MTTQLYPPIISEKIPAFYIKDDAGVITATITVPFSMNRAVDSSTIKGFKLKIKTVQTGKIIATIEKTDIENIQNINQVKFTWDNSSAISKKYIGQFLKIQMAYIDTKNVVGLYSDISIVKCTAQPSIYIEEFKNFSNDNQYPSFNYTYTGVYENINDSSEKPYLYNFILYKDNNKENVIEESGWQVYNLNEDISKKVHTFSAFIDMDDYETYWIEYKVKTINDLEESSGLYPCGKPAIEITNTLQLKAENVFDEGYINLSFHLLENTDIEQIKLNLYRKNKYSTEPPVLLQREYFENVNDIQNWSFKDFSIEQGITYNYIFRYEQNGIESESFMANKEITADFEDMFLWDGEKQIKIRFNPKVSSFKINRQEQKVETIGSSFPMFFRNGKIHYKEFPISGLISYHLDKNELFVSAKNDLKIILDKNLERFGTPEPADDINDSTPIETLNLLNYNIQAERQFKLKLLDWLSDGKVKLFKSPTEGNYLVRLLNVSLSPEDKLGRMLHSFSCTAYEVDEYSYNNLIKNGLVIIKDFSELMPKNLLNFSFLTKTLYGEGDGENSSFSSLGLSTSSINGFQEDGVKKKNILIFKNKKERTISDFKYYLLKTKENNNLFYFPKDSNDHLLITSAIPEKNILLKEQGIIYHSPFEEPDRQKSYYYWIESEGEYSLIGPEKKCNFIRIEYTETDFDDFDISNLNQLMIVFTYRKKDNSNSYFIDTIKIIEKDNFNNEKIIKEISGNEETKISAILMSNQIYLTNIQQRFIQE